MALLAEQRMETGAGHKTSSNAEGAVRRLSVGLDLCAKALYTPLYSSFVLRVQKSCFKLYFYR